MTEAQIEDKPAFLIPIGGARLLQVVSLGAVVGLTVWALAQFLETYVFQSILCHDASVLRCASGTQYAEAFASIIGAGIGLFFLVRIQTFRPLLVALSSTVSLWGLVNLTQSLPWYGVGIACVLLYAAAYAAFIWISRIRVFWLVMLLLVALIVAIRLILNS